MVPPERSLHLSLLPLRDAFIDALRAVGLDQPLHQQHAEDGYDFTVELDGIPGVVEVKAAPSVADVHHLAALPANGYKILVGRRISAAVRDVLDAQGIGFYDGRGHLRLMHPPQLRIDAPARPIAATPAAPRSSRRRGGLAPSALDVAVGVLAGHAAGSINQLGRIIGRAPSTTWNALDDLRRGFLIEDQNQPVVPDLFEAVLEQWQPHRIALAGMPRAGDGRLNTRLQLHLGDLDQAGWCLADTHAALAWGAPMFVVGSSPPDFYVPSRHILGAAIRAYGEASYGEHACTVAVPPAPVVCRIRQDRSKTHGAVFPVASPVVAALDLAADPGRGREMLDRWSDHLNVDITRVW